MPSIMRFITIIIVIAMRLKCKEIFKSQILPIKMHQLNQLA
jgi:hypothetical protein